MASQSKAAEYLKKQQETLKRAQDNRKFAALKPAREHAQDDFARGQEPVYWPSGEKRKGK